MCSNVGIGRDLVFVLQVHVQPPSIANADQLLRSCQCMTWLVRLKEMEASMSLIPSRLSIPLLCGALVFVETRPPRFSFPEMCSCVACVAKAPRARRLRTKRRLPSRRHVHVRCATNTCPLTCMRRSQSCLLPLIDSMLSVVNRLPFMLSVSSRTPFMLPAQLMSSTHILKVCGFSFLSL